MAWDGWPPVEGFTKRIEWDWIIQLWEAVRERGWMSDNVTLWPRTNQIFASGIITGLVDNGGNAWTMTDSTNAPAPGTDDGTYWNGTARAGGCDFVDYWVQVDCTDFPPETPFLNGNYLVWIQPDNGEEEWYRDQDPRAIIRGEITANTSKTLTFTANIANYVTAKVIEANPASTLIGARYYIMRAAQGLFWASHNFTSGRYPDWPNDRELWRGKLTGENDVGKMYTDGTGYIYEEQNKVRNDPYNHPELRANAWAANQWLTDPPAEVLAYDANDNLKRLTITGNDSNTIFFGGLTAIPTPEEEAELTVDYEFDAYHFTIVPPGSRGWPERKPWHSAWWYGGAFDNVYTHDPSDTLVARTGSFAADSVQWEESEDTDLIPCGSEPSIRTEHDALDKDIWTSVTNQCNPADFCFSPHLHKSFRFIQHAVISRITTCVRPTDYTNAPEIPLYSVARCFHDAGINAGTATMQSEVAGANTVYYFIVSAAYRTWPVYWDALKTTGVRKSTGFTASDVAGKVVVATVVTSGGDHTWAGNTIYYSAGFTRRERLEFTHMRERGAFIPDAKQVLGSEVVIYPPLVDDFCGPDDPPCANDCFGVGAWIYRGPSTGYRTYSAHGYAQDAANDYVAGKAARYVGNTHHDPGTGTTFESDDDAGLMPYWDRFYEGQHPKTMQATLRAQRAGTVLYATARSITDTGKHWFTNWYTPNGTMRTESGTATAGTTTTLTLTTTLTDATNEAHCWWQSSRWSAWMGGGTKPFLNFVLEIDHEIEGETVTFKMPITDVTNNTPGNAPVLHFDPVKDANDDNVDFDAGDVWRIVEPATTHLRWRGLRVKLIRIDLTSFEVEVTHNDDNTLWFAEQTDPNNVPQPGWSYEIVEYETGGVWKFQTTEPTNEQKATLRWQKVGTNKYWVQPTGADPRGADWHFPTHQNMTENLANAHPKKFGLWLKGDAIGIHLYLEVYALLNLLWQTKRAGVPWRARYNLLIAEPNHRGSPSEGSAFITWLEGQTDVEAAYASGAAETAAGTASRPVATTDGSKERLEGNEYYTAGAKRVASYAYISGLPYLLACTVDFYAHSEDMVISYTIPPDESSHGSTFESTFNANGDGLANNAWGKFSTVTRASGITTEVISSRLGGGSSMTFPVWVPEPTTPPVPSEPPFKQGPSAGFQTGYRVDDEAIGVIKWTGLRYCTFQTV